MYIPEFVITKREREILAPLLSRRILLKEFAFPLHVYVVDERQFQEICNFTSGFRENLNEAAANRPQLLRAVTLVFNMMSDVQKIKDPDTKTAAGASILAAIMGIYSLAPEYGNRLIGMLRSKV